MLTPCATPEHTASLTPNWRRALASGSLTMGSGTTLTKLVSTTAVWDPGSIIANGSQSTTVTVTGAAVGDAVFVDNPYAQLDNNSLAISAYVTAADTVTVRLFNNDTVSVDPASRTIRVTVLKF